MKKSWSNSTSRMQWLTERNNRTWGQRDLQISFHSYWFALINIQCVIGAPVIGRTIYRLLRERGYKLRTYIPRTTPRLSMEASLLWGRVRSTWNFTGCSSIAVSDEFYFWMKPDKQRRCICRCSKHRWNTHLSIAPTQSDITFSISNATSFDSRIALLSSGILYSTVVRRKYCIHYLFILHFTAPRAYI